MILSRSHQRDLAFVSNQQILRKASRVLAIPDIVLAGELILTIAVWQRILDACLQNES